MSARITKAEADAAARCIEAALAGGVEDADWRREDEDAHDLDQLLQDVVTKLWNRT